MSRAPTQGPRLRRPSLTRLSPNPAPGARRLSPVTCPLLGPPCPDPYRASKTGRSRPQAPSPDRPRVPQAGGHRPSLLRRACGVPATAGRLGQSRGQEEAALRIGPRLPLRTYPPPPRRSRSRREPGEGRGARSQQRARGAWTVGGGRFLVALLRAGAREGAAAAYPAGRGGLAYTSGARGQAEARGGPIAGPAVPRPRRGSGRAEEAVAGEVREGSSDARLPRQPACCCRCYLGGGSDRLTSPLLLCAGRLFL